MAQRYEYQDIDGHVILLFVHPARLYVYVLDNTGFVSTANIPFQVID